MNIGATLVGQMITFGIFVWFTMRFIWPLLQSALHERQDKISKGLAAAEKGEQMLKDAGFQSQEIIDNAKINSKNIISNAEQEAMEIVEQSKQEAMKVKSQIIVQAEQEIRQSVMVAKEELQKKFADLVVLGTRNILGKSINAKDHEEMLNKLAQGVSDS